MPSFTRRQIFQTGLVGLAAGGVASLTLRSDAHPTTSTTDAHGYEEFLNKNGIPQIHPAKKWERTSEDILGPYHLTGAPFRGKVTPPLEPGKLLMVNGRIWGFDTKKPITSAVMDVWQADAKGSYDMDDPRNPPAKSEFKNRIRLVVDESGFYEYETIRPAAYQIGQGTFRPSHIHYMVQAPGYKKLITQLYFKGDPNIKTDRWASNSNLVIDPKAVKTANGSYELGRFDIVLEPA